MRYETTNGERAEYAASFQLSERQQHQPLATRNPLVHDSARLARDSGMAARETTNGPSAAALDPGRWVDEHADALFRFAMVRLRDAAVAEELVRLGDHSTRR